jgi:hypothetical protein
MIITALAISLFATICIDGTLHGQPKTICHEFQIRHYDTIDACEKARKTAVDEWLAGIVFIQPHLVGERCGPAEADMNGDDI